MSQSRSEYDGSLYPGVRRAYRLWKLNTKTYDKLDSLGQNYSWETKELTAKCLASYQVVDLAGEVMIKNNTHRAPQDGCFCGIYARYRAEDLWDNWNHDYPMILGAVDASGIVMEGSKGIKAEKAVIRGIFLMSNKLRGLDRKVISNQLATKYGVDEFHSEQDLVEAYPPDDDVPEPPVNDISDWWGLAPPGVTKFTTYSSTKNTITFSAGGSGQVAYGWDIDPDPATSYVATMGAEELYKNLMGE